LADNPGYCLDLDLFNPLKALVLLFAIAPGILYATIADPVSAGWAVIYLGLLYLGILLLLDKPPIWATLTVAILSFITNLIVIYHVPTHKTLYPFLIVEKHPVEHMSVEGIYKVSYIDISQIFLLIEAVRIYLRCRARRNNYLKPEPAESNKTPEAAVV
jgi:hypothetical protein